MTVHSVIATGGSIRCITWSCSGGRWPRLRVPEPIRQWRPQWPAHYEIALERLRERHGYSRGTRAFIAILQLHQDWDLDRVSSAIQEALDAHCIELEAVRHILMREDTPTRSHAPLESGLMPGITDLTIARADLDQYDRLLAGGVR